MDRDPGLLVGSIISSFSEGLDPEVLKTQTKNSFKSNIFNHKILREKRIIDYFRPDPNMFFFRVGS